MEVDAPRGSADIDIESVALYAAYRTLGQLCLVARIGFLRDEISSEDVDGEPEDESGGSLGIGGGYRLTPNLALEADYTVVEEDISWLMLAARYTFRDVLALPVAD